MVILKSLVRDGAFFILLVLRVLSCQSESLVTYCLNDPLEIIF